MLLRARFERHARAWSKARAADRAGISTRDLDDIEDDRRPEPAALRALAAVYGFAPAYAHLLLDPVPPALDPEARRAAIEQEFADVPEPEVPPKLREARQREAEHAADIAAANARILKGRE